MRQPDAIEEYCQYLSGALRGHDFELELARVAWAEDGWPAAMRELERKAKDWRGCWVLVQYTALSWSERGFPSAISHRECCTNSPASGSAGGDGLP